MREFVVELKPFNADYLQAGNIFFYEDIGRMAGSTFAGISPPDAIQLKKILHKEVLIIKTDIIAKCETFPEITLSMFERANIGSFEQRKLSQIRIIDSKITYITANISAIELFEFYVIITSFAEKGIIINDANREEKYLEIVASEDESLIILLERYLELKDKIDDIYKKYNQLVNGKKLISNTTNDEQLEEVLKEVNPYARTLKVKEQG